MIRFLLRFVGLLLLALGFIFLVYDGIRSISDGSILLTRTSEVWNIVHDRSLASFQTLERSQAAVMNDVPDLACPGEQDAAVRNGADAVINQEDKSQGEQ